MPQAPAHAQNEHAQPFPIPFLKNGLKKTSPAIFFSEKRGIDHEKIKRKHRQIQPHIRVRKRRKKRARHALHRIIQENAQEIQEQKQKDPQPGADALPAFPAFSFFASLRSPSPAETVFLSDFFFFQKQKHPGNQASHDERQIDRHRHANLREEYARHAERHQNPRQNQKSCIEFHRDLFLRLPGKKHRQHHARRGIVHLRIGKGAHVRSSVKIDSHQHAHRKRQTEGRGREDAKPLFFKLCQFRSHCPFPFKNLSAPSLFLSTGLFSSRIPSLMRIVNSVFFMT